MDKAMFKSPNVYFKRRTGIRVKNEINVEKNVIWELFQEINLKYDFLAETDYNEKNSQFQLFSKPTKDDHFEKTILIVSNEKKYIALASKEIVNADEWRKLSLFIFDLIVKKINILPLSIENIDNQFRLIIPSKKNHYRTLFKFFNIPGYSEITEVSNVYNFSPALHSFLDKTEEIVCVIDFNSNSDWESNQLDEFKTEIDFEVQCGIAKVGGFRGAINMNEQFELLYSKSEEFFSGPFLNKILIPIENYFAQLK